jgi:hypothetical protein
MNKLELLAKNWGLTVADMLDCASFDSMTGGICTNDGCDFTTDVETDCARGFCEVCGTKTVASCLVLAGIH